MSWRCKRSQWSAAMLLILCSWNIMASASDRLTHWPLGDFDKKFRQIIFKLILVIEGWSISCEIAIRWMPLDLTDDESTLVQVMAWCRQATSHYLNQCWPNSMPPYGVTRPQWVNTLSLRQNGRHFAEDIFKCIFLNENVWILISISLKYMFPKYPINIIPALVQIMACSLSGGRPLSEPMLVSLLTYICVTWPHWVNSLAPSDAIWHSLGN